MPKDDFLKQFQQEPSQKFGHKLLEHLKQLDNQQGDPVDEKIFPPNNPKTPIELVASPRTRTRSVDRYFTAIASLLIFIFISSALIFNLRINNEAGTNRGIVASSPPRTEGLTEIAWTPDGRMLYVADAHYLYRLNTRLQLIDSLPLALQGIVTAMTFSPDGTYLILGDSAGTLTLWSTETRELLSTLHAHDMPVDVMAYIPQHNQLISSSSAGDLLVTEIRNEALFVLTREMVSQDAVPMSVAGLTVHPNGRTIIATMNNTATFTYLLDADGTLDLSAEEFALSDFPPALQAAYSVDGQRITYVWWDNLVVMDSDTLVERYRYTLPDRLLGLRPLQVSETSDRVLLTNNRNLIALWDFPTETYTPIFEISQALNHDIQAALHPDGSLVAAITQSQEVHLWQINTVADEKLEIDVVEIAVNRPGINRPASTYTPTALQAIDADNISDVRELHSFGDGYLTQVLWSPDGSTLIVTSTRTIRVYDSSLQLLRELPLVGFDIVRAVFSSEGRYLLTASSTGTLSIWDITTGRMLTSLAGVHDDPVTLLTFLSSRNRILSRDESGEFVMLHFDGNTMRILNRSSSDALSSYTVNGWYLDGHILRLVMVRPERVNRANSDLINVVDFNLSGEFQAEDATTNIRGELAIFLEHGQSVLVYEQARHNLMILDSQDFELSRTISLPDSLTSITSMQRDELTGFVLLRDYDNELYLYDSSTHQIQAIDNVGSITNSMSDTIALHPNEQSIAWISSRNRVVIGDLFQTVSSLSLRQRATDTPVLGQIQTFITGPNNLAAATTTDGALLLFDGLSGNLLRRIPLTTWGTRNHDIIFDPTGSVLVVIGQDLTGFDTIVNILDVQAAILGEADVHLSQSPYVFEREFVSGMAFNPSGTWLITGGSQVRTWSLNTDPFYHTWTTELRGLTIFAHHPSQSEAATIRPGNYLRVIGTSNMVNRYLTRLIQRSLPASTFLQYTADGSAIILGVGGQAPEVYDTDTGERLFSLEGSSSGDFLDMTLSHDGEYLFMVDEAGIAMWDLDDAFSGQRQASRIQLDFAASQIATTTDNTRLFVVGHDGMVHVMGIPQ